MSEAQCGYRAESCSDIGRMVNGKWQCQRHIDMDELQRLRDERDRLVAAMEAAIQLEIEMDGPHEFCQWPERRACVMCILKAALTPARGQQGEGK